MERQRGCGTGDSEISNMPLVLDRIHSLTISKIFHLITLLFMQLMDSSQKNKSTLLGPKP